MRSIVLCIEPTVEAIRDQAILKENGVRSEVVPYYKAPSFYVGDNAMSELLVLEDQVEKARQLLNLPDPADD